MVKEFKEKVITINLRRAYEKPVTKRAKAALFVIKDKVRKETRAENMKLSNLVNETVWERGLYKPPRKITVKVIPAKDGVDVYLVDEKVKQKTAEGAQKGEKKAEPKGVKEKVTDTQKGTETAVKAKEETKAKEEKAKTPKVVEDAQKSEEEKETPKAEEPAKEKTKAESSQKGEVVKEEASEEK